MLGDLVVAQPIMGAVIKVGGEPLGQAVALAIVAHAIDDVIALAPFGDHRDQGFGRVLQVDVHRHHGAPADMIEPGRQRGFLAEIARQRDRADARVGGVGIADFGQRAVGAAVVDEQDFVSCLPPGHRASSSTARTRVRNGADRLFLVLDRDDDRKLASCEHPAAVEGEGQQRRDEDDRDHRPPGRPAQLLDQQPDEELVGDEAERG